MGKPTPALFALTTLAAGLANTMAKVLEDGKVSWAELFQFAPHVMRVANNTEQYKAAWAEIEDGLDEEQLKALRDHAAQQIDFGAAQKDIEQFVETCINSVLYNIKLVYDALALRKIDGLELGGVQARGGLTVAEVQEGESPLNKLNNELELFHELDNELELFRKKLHTGYPRHGGYIANKFQEWANDLNEHLGK